jgi:hypothetical protein
VKCLFGIIRSISQGVEMGNRILNLLEILENGQALKLSDGTLFQVDPYDQSEVKSWDIFNAIELAKTRDVVFNYTLTNTSTDAWVRAMKLN